MHTNMTYKTAFKSSNVHDLLQLQTLTHLTASNKILLGLPIDSEQCYPTYGRS